MVKSAPSLSVRPAFPYHRYILFIGIRLAIFVLIVVAPYGHRFNLAYKGEVDHIQAGDEAYIKVAGKHNFVFFFISSCSRKITTYHIEKSRDTLPAVIAMQEAIRTASPEEEITLVTDGNPSYPAGIHFINQN